MAPSPDESQSTPSLSPKGSRWRKRIQSERQQPLESKPWLIQDSVALGVFLLFAGLFVGSLWSTSQDWPAIRNQTENLKIQIHRAERVRENPEILSKSLEITLKKANDAIADLKKKKFNFEQDLRESDAIRAAYVLESDKHSTTAKDEARNLDDAKDRAESEVGKLEEAISLKTLLENGPGPEPDPLGPNGWRKEWLLWDAKKKTWEHAKNIIESAKNTFDSANRALNDANAGLKRATAASERIRAAIVATEDQLNKMLDDRAAAKRVLETAFVNTDPEVNHTVERIQKELRESEAARSVLLILNLPTILALLVATISAMVRLLLLRDKFSKRAFITHQ